MDVTIKGSGLTDNVEAQVDSSFSALRVSLKPQDYVVGGVVGGHYSGAFPTGSVTGRAAGDVLFGWRWASSGKICVVKRVSVTGVVTTAGTAPTIDYDLIRAQSFTVNYVTGSTKQAFNAQSHKLRSVMAPSELVNYGDVYAATTGAATGQTATLDSIPIGYAVPPWPSAAVGVGAPPADLWKQDKMAEHPLILQNGEGFAIRVGTAQGASVAVKSVFIVEWVELSTY